MIVGCFAQLVVLFIHTTSLAQGLGLVSSTYEDTVESPSGEYYGIVYRPHGRFRHRRIYYDMGIESEDSQPYYYHNHKKNYRRRNYMNIMRQVPSEKACVCNCQDCVRPDPCCQSICNSCPTESSLLYIPYPVIIQERPPPPLKNVTTSKTTKKPTTRKTTKKHKLLLNQQPHPTRVSPPQTVQSAKPVITRKRDRTRKRAQPLQKGQQKKRVRTRKRYPQPLTNQPTKRVTKRKRYPQPLTNQPTKRVTKRKRNRTRQQDPPPQTDQQTQRVTLRKQHSQTTLLLPVVGGSPSTIIEYVTNHYSDSSEEKRTTKKHKKSVTRKIRAQLDTLMKKIKAIEAVMKTAGTDIFANLISKRPENFENKELASIPAVTEAQPSLAPEYSILPIPDNMQSQEQMITQ